MRRLRIPTAIGALLLLSMTVLVYLPAMKGGYVWDDVLLVRDNTNLLTSAGLVRTWTDFRANIDFYPLTITSWWLEHRIWGANTFVFHLDNVLLHAGTAILLWLILRFLAVPGAWAAAAIFALHPVHVQSVAWIAERKNVLSGFLCLLCVWSFLRFALVDGKEHEQRRRLYYGLSLLAFLCSLLAKPATMAVAAVLPLLLWLQRRKLTWKDARVLVPFFVAATFMAAVTIWVQYTLVGARGESFQHSFLQRLVLAGRVLWFYADKLMWPRDLTIAYARWTIDTSVWWQYRYSAGAVAVLATVTLARQRIGLGPLVAVLTFIAMLAPALGFVNIYWHRYFFVADHVPYLASVGLIAGATAATISAAKLVSWGRPAARVLTAALLVVFGMLTYRQAGIYKDAESIWRDNIEKNPQSWLGHGSLGVELFKQGKTAEAIIHYLKALDIHPDDPVTHYNLGLAYGRLARTRESEAAFRRAVQLLPDYSEAHLKLANLLIEEGKNDEARGHLERAHESNLAARAVHSPFVSRSVPSALFPDQSLRVLPDQAREQNSLGNALLELRQVDQAIDRFRTALRLKPDFADAHYNLGRALFAQRKYAEAGDHFSEAIRINPGLSEPHNNLGGVLALQGKTAEAIQQYREAVRINPGNAAAHYNLGRCLYKMGSIEKAIAEYQLALRVDPNSVNAQSSLKEAREFQARNK